MSAGIEFLFGTSTTSGANDAALPSRQVKVFTTTASLGWSANQSKGMGSCEKSCGSIPFLFFWLRGRLRQADMAALGIRTIRDVPACYGQRLYLEPIIGCNFRNSELGIAT